MWLINDASWLVDNLLIGIIWVIVFTVGMIIFIFPAVVIIGSIGLFAWWFNNEGVRDDYKEWLRRNPPPPANVNYVPITNNWNETRNANKFYKYIRTRYIIYNYPGYSKKEVKKAMVFLLSNPHTTREDLNQMTIIDLNQCF